MRQSTGRALESGRSTAHLLPHTCSEDREIFQWHNYPYPIVIAALTLDDSAFTWNRKFLDRVFHKRLSADGELDFGIFRL